MAASPVRRSRRTGSTRKVVCSHTPVRTRGSASSIMTAATPPMKSESGFLNTRHDTESGETSAASPMGRKKSEEDWSPKSNNALVAASKLLRSGQGRTIGVVTVTSSFASPEYRFELVFQRSRRNSQCAKPRQIFGGRGVDLHKFDLIAGERRLRHHLSKTGQCIP